MRIINKQSFIRRRFDSAGYYDDSGSWIDGGTVDDPIRGSLQPPSSSKDSANIQLVLPESSRLEDSRLIYTRSELRTSNDRTGETADQIIFYNPHTNSNDIYEVMKVDTWYAIKQLSHFKGYLALVDREKL